MFEEVGVGYIIFCCLKTCNILNIFIFRFFRELQYQQKKIVFADIADIVFCELK